MTVECFVMALGSLIFRSVATAYLVSPCPMVGLSAMKYIFRNILPTTASSKFQCYCFKIQVSEVVLDVLRRTDS